MDERPRYSVSQVLGTGRTEQLLCARVTLPEPALSVLDVHRTVLIDHADATLGNLILQGRLRALYRYVAARHGAASGPVMAPQTDIPLAVRIAIPQSRPGLMVRMQAAHVTADSLLPGAQDRTGALRSLQDRAVVLLAAEVLTQVDLVDPGPAKGRQPSVPPPGAAGRPGAAMARFSTRRRE